MTALDQLRLVTPPWLHLVVLDRGKELESVGVVPPGFVSRTIDGRRARTKRELLAECARAFEFPGGSGSNWDAFEEMLADLEWLPATGYLLIVTDADELLADHPDDYRTFIGIVEDVAREWATPRRGDPGHAGVPFHVCLVVARDRKDARKNWSIPSLVIGRDSE